MPQAEPGPADAPVGPAAWASRYLPTSLPPYLPTSLSLRRRSYSAPAKPAGPPPEPVAIPLHLLSGEDVVLESTVDSSLEQLQRGCEQAAGVPAMLQSLLVQEVPLQPGLRGLAHSVSSRHHLSRQLADWSSFLLLPEGVRRELRGQGLAGWLRQHVWERLQPPRQAPPGTVWVLVATLDGGRHPILLSSATTLQQLPREVQQHTGVPPAQQQLAVVERRESGRAALVLRALLALLLVVWGWLVAGLRWLLDLPGPSDVKVSLQTESGREVEIEVSPDITLREMQQLVWEQHGEQLGLQAGLSLSPARAGSLQSGRSGGWRGGGEGGGGGSSASASTGSSPSKRRLLL